VEEVEPREVEEVEPGEVEEVEKFKSGKVS
jgi:hypothetical protein